MCESTNNTKNNFEKEEIVGGEWFWASKADKSLIEISSKTKYIYIYRFRRPV
jgi:hypothetical protein